MISLRPSLMFLAGLLATVIATASICMAQSTKQITKQITKQAIKQAALIPALKLTQTHFYFGDTDTIVSMQGVRINNRGRMKFVLVAKSPDWVVFVFRDDDHTYISKSLQAFQTSGLVSNLLVKSRQQEVSLGTTKDVKVYGLTVKQTDNSLDEFEYLPLQNYAAPQVERIIRAAYKLPTNGGIPIRYKRISRGKSDKISRINTVGDLKSYIVTKKIERVMVPAELFEVPHGYAVRTIMQEVLMSKIHREASGDMDVWFDIGKPPKP